MWKLAKIYSIYTKNTKGNNLKDRNYANLIVFGILRSIAATAAQQYYRLINSVNAAAKPDLIALRYYRPVKKMQNTLSNYCVNALKIANTLVMKTSEIINWTKQREMFILWKI